MGNCQAAPATRGYRWVVVTVAFLTFFVSFLDRLAWPAVEGFAHGAFGESVTTLSSFITAFYVAYVVTSATSGFATDRLGPRRILVLAVGSLGFATALFGLSVSWHQGLVAQGLMGTFAGADYAACVKVVAACFDRFERGRALGLLMTAPSIGIAVANAAFPSMVAVVGWRALYGLLGALTALIALACALVVRDPPRRDRPAPSGGPHPQPLRVARAVALLTRDRNVRLIALTGFGANWGTWGFSFWATSLMVRGHGLAPVQAGVVTAIFGCTAAASKPLYGLLSDIVQSRRGLVVADLTMFASMLIAFGAMTSPRAFLLTAPFLGATAVIYSPLLAAMITETVPASTVATATGIVNALWQLGSAAVPLIVGAVFASSGSFPAAFAALALGPAVGSVCAVGIREHRPDQVVMIDGAGVP